MRVLGIIAEYNPFHFGHLYHLKRSKEITQADYTIAVMSGSFTQRGEAAITDKWIRAEAAVRCGVDLVLELPVVYAVQTAELFAYGGIQTLNHTGLASHVSFGSEIGNLEPLEQVADILASEDQAYKDILKWYLQQGLSFPAARYRAVLEYIESKQDYKLDSFRNDKCADYNAMTNKSAIKKLLYGSNSILAIEYLKALKQTGSSILPVTIPRISSAYRSQRIKKGAASATSIRNEIFRTGMSRKVREAVPEATFQVLSEAFDNGAGPMDNRELENLILGLIRRSSAADIAAWMDVGEGLENRILECAQKASSLDELLTMMKTKRYVHTRLQRILVHGLLGLTTEAFQRLNDDIGPKYLRILAFSKDAAPLLKKLKETSKVPVITKAAHVTRYNEVTQEMFAYDRLASDLYGLGMKNPLLRKGDRDYTHGIIIV
jgi:predicted nucleotidyltransferase